MSRKDSQLPWRVLAISMLLFGILAAAGWFMFGPTDSAQIPGAANQGTEDAGGTSATAPEQAIAPATDPQAGASPLDPDAIDPTSQQDRAALAALRADAGVMDLQLFLIVPSLERLIPMSVKVPAPPTLDGQIHQAVEELINWDGTSTVSPVAPEAGVRETWVSPGGIAYLDFDQSFYDFSGGGSLGELHTIYGILHTITESFPEIVAVQFLVEGERKDTLAGHIDLSRPLLPSDEWVLIESGSRQIRQSDGSG